MAESRNYDGADVPDKGNTYRAHAGEGIQDTRNWPGIILMGLGLAFLGITLTVAGYGFEGWAWISAAICVACFAVGLATLLLEHRRLKRLEGRGLTEQAGH